MTLQEAKDIVLAYEELLAQALRTMYMPNGQGVEEDRAILFFSDDQPKLKWVEYESGYYGDGHLSDQEADVDANLLLLPADDLEAVIASAAKEDTERREKLRRAQEAVQRDRAEAQERALFAHLKQKYG